MANFSDEIRIDENALDVEWLEQPMLMLKYTKQEAQARKALDLAKEALDLVKATLDKAIRSNPADFGLDKLTETIVVNTIILADDWKAANEEVIQKSYELNIYTSAVKAIAQRKDALQNLVQLHGLQYFAGPTSPHDLSTQRRMYSEAKKKSANNAVANAQKKKTVRGIS